MRHYGESFDALLGGDDFLTLGMIKIYRSSLARFLKMSRGKDIYALLVVFVWFGELVGAHLKWCIRFTIAIGSSSYKSK